MLAGLGGLCVRFARPAPAVVDRGMTCGIELLGFLRTETVASVGCQLKRCRMGELGFPSINRFLREHIPYPPADSPLEPRWLC